MGCDTSPIFCSLFITFKVFLFLNIKKWWIGIVALFLVIHFKRNHIYTCKYRINKKKVYKGNLCQKNYHWGIFSHIRPSLKES
jgi:hypothetical protein